MRIGLLTNIPGAWPIHCHMGWHLVGGKLAVMAVQIEGAKQPNTSAEVAEVCPHLFISSLSFFAASNTLHNHRN